jgi:hypothetical protein
MPDPMDLPPMARAPHIGRALDTIAAIPEGACPCAMCSSFLSLQAQSSSDAGSQMTEQRLTRAARSTRLRQSLPLAPQHRPEKRARSDYGHLAAPAWDSRERRDQFRCWWTACQGRVTWGISKRKGTAVRCPSMCGGGRSLTRTRLCRNPCIRDIYWETCTQCRCLSLLDLTEKQVLARPSGEWHTFKSPTEQGILRAQQGKASVQQRSPTTRSAAAARWRAPHFERLHGRGSALNASLGAHLVFVYNGVNTLARRHSF